MHILSLFVMKSYVQSSNLKLSLSLSEHLFVWLCLYSPLLFLNFLHRLILKPRPTVSWAIFLTSTLPQIRRVGKKKQINNDSAVCLLCVLVAPLLIYANLRRVLICILMLVRDAFRLLGALALVWFIAHLNTNTPSLKNPSYSLWIFSWVSKNFRIWNLALNVFNKQNHLSMYK